MSTTTTNRNLLVIIGVLLLTNIGVLIYFLSMNRGGDDKPGQRKDRGGLTDMLRDDVGFNDEQVKRYKELKDAQWNTIRPMFDDMRKAKDSLYRLIGVANVSDSMVNMAATVIGKKQEALDLKAFEHFKKVRTLCTVEQQPKYDTMIVRMFRKMGKPRKPGENKDEKK